MPDKKVSAFDAATALSDTDMVPFVTAAGATKKIVGADLRTAVGFTKIVPKLADESINTNGSVQSDDELLWAISSSSTEIWFFEAVLRVVAANTTMDFKIGLTAPSGASAYWGIANSAGVSVNGWGVQTTGATPSGLVETVAGPISVGTTAGVTQGMNFSGWVLGGGTAGNVVVQWSQATSDGSNLTVKKGSFLRLMKLVA